MPRTHSPPVGAAMTTRRSLLIGASAVAAVGGQGMPAAGAGGADLRVLDAAHRFLEAAILHREAVAAMRAARLMMTEMVGPTPPALIADARARALDGHLLEEEVGPDDSTVYEPCGRARRIYCPESVRRQIPHVLAGRGRIAFLEEVQRLGAARAAAIAQARAAVGWGDLVEAEFWCERALSVIADELAGIRATTPEGRRAKAEVVVALSADATAQKYARAHLAVSLAEDLVGIKE